MPPVSGATWPIFIWLLGGAAGAAAALGASALAGFFLLAASGKRDRGGNRQRHERNGASIHDLFSSVSVGRKLSGSGSFAR